MHPSDVPAFPSHRAHPPHSHGEAEQEERSPLWGSLITRATPPPAGKRDNVCPKRDNVCPEGASNVGDTGEPPSCPGKGWAGQEPLSRAQCVNPAWRWSWAPTLLLQQSWGAPGSWNSWKHIPLAPNLPPEPGQAEKGHEICLLLLLLGTVPGQGARAGSHGPAGPILGVLWTQELQQDGIAYPGTGDRTCSPHTNVGQAFPGHCPSTSHSSVLLSPSCPQRMAP